jgi:hypothetical protein
MMQFFEFFFREPGWVWRFLCLLILLETVGSFISSIIEAFTKCHLAALASNDDDNDDSDAAIEVDDSDHGATADDVRR